MTSRTLVRYDLTLTVSQFRSFINNTKRRKEDLFKTALSVSLTKLNYRCLKLQQEACIRKLVLDCNDDDVFAVLPSANWLLHIIYMISATNLF